MAFVRFFRHLHTACGTIACIAVSCSNSESSIVDSVGTPNGGSAGSSGFSGQGGEMAAGNAGAGAGVAGAGATSTGGSANHGGVSNGGSAGWQGAGQGGTACKTYPWRSISKSPIDENRSWIQSATNGKTVLFAGGSTFVFDGPPQPKPDSATYDPSSDTWVGHGFFDDSTRNYTSSYGDGLKYAHLGSHDLWVTDGLQWNSAVTNIGTEPLQWGKMFFVQGRLLLWGVQGAEVKMFRYDEPLGVLEEVGKKKPISYLTEAASAMSDDGKLLIWGGKDESGLLLSKGYIYDVMNDSWQSIPEPPIAPRSLARAVWIGDRFLIWGGFRDTLEQELGGAEFSPQENTWKAVQDNGAQIRAKSIHWTGKKVLFWADKNSFFYTPESGVWEKMSSCGAPEKNSGVAQWTESGLVVWGEGNQGSLYLNE